ncbi:MAG: hypothetical protein ABSB95_10220 [Dissulfurispiraceae bacterium]|jgi:hypothetical protein
MTKTLIAFRTILVAATAFFMAFHTETFISRIEPNVTLAWLAAGLIEGMLISLALMRSYIARILIVPLFLISVLAASMSFVVKNENLLNGFFQNQRVMDQLKRDLSDTERDFQRGDKYTTKTLQRSRQLQDQMLLALNSQNGWMPLFNAGVFLVLVLVLQGVSVYTAMTLKNTLIVSFPFRPNGDCHIQERDKKAVSCESPNRADENAGDNHDCHRHNGDAPAESNLSFETELSADEKSDNSYDAVAEVLRLHGEGLRPDLIAMQTRKSLSTVYRILRKNRTNS